MLIGGALAWMLALSCYDIRQRRLPNWLTIPGFAVITLAAGGFGHFRAALVGAAALAAVYLLVHLLAPAAMGAGDVKLALGLGALTGCFGADAWLLAALAAPVLTVAIGILARVGWSVRAVPHGPSMCAASAAAVGLAQLA
jgi:leader peptidase (prepilin peptidase) / N-methyltransferase